MKRQKQTSLGSITIDFDETSFQDPLARPWHDRTGSPNDRTAHKPDRRILENGARTHGGHGAAGGCWSHLLRHPWPGEPCEPGRVRMGEKQVEKGKKSTAPKFCPSQQKPYPCTKNAHSKGELFLDKNQIQHLKKKRT